MDRIVSISDSSTSQGIQPQTTAHPDPLSEVTGCWSQIGVYGDGGCLELRKFVHCRNCPVYSAAGLRLLDKALPPDYRREWTQHFAQERRLPETGNASVILFRIQNDWLALPTRNFQEVAEKRPMHSLPHGHRGIILGLANVRGELVICISLGHLLQLNCVPSMGSLRLNHKRLLVIQCESGRLAFPVDEVQGPHRFAPHDLQNSPGSLSPASSRFVHGLLRWQEHSAGLLDPDQLLSGLQRSLA